MQGTALVHDPKFQDRVVAETRALLATMAIVAGPLSRFRAASIVGGASSTSYSLDLGVGE